MHHKFEHIKIPEGQKKVTEVCSCGQTSVRYISGVRLYPDGNNPCTRENDAKPSKPKKKQQPKEEEPEPYALEGSKIDPKVSEEVKPWADFIKPKEPPLTDQQARLKECLVMLRLGYDEIVSNGIMSNTRLAIGRFLYSQGYQDLRAVVEPQNLSSQNQS